jgi:signal transduction histidine kinase
MVLVQTPDRLEHVWADPWLTWQVVTHLINRALAHTPRGEGVIVAVRTGERNVTLSVADGGLGIPLCRRDQASGERPQRMQAGEAPFGQDIWLSFCKRAIEAQQGQMWIESSEGQGHEVKFTLPLVR